MDARRLLSFSDGFFAIIITVMVLSLRQPDGATFANLRSTVPSLTAYALSFLYLGTYWNNHHHLLFTVRKVTGGMLWSNLNLLFWLSLFPFCTRWMAGQHYASQTVAAYGIVLVLAAFAYVVLQNVIVASQAPDTSLKEALGQDAKGKSSMFFYLLSIPLALVWNWGGVIIFVGVAVLWLVPDRRLERYFDHHAPPD
ncbi:MAG: TMEM175 family protein [Acidimicrobiales bacterium]